MLLKVKRRSLPIHKYVDLPEFVEAEDRSRYNDEEPDDSLMMRLFLDFAIAEALKNQDLKPYTTEMSVRARDLIAGVELDDE
jgi:hypothetical protein